MPAASRTPVPRPPTKSPPAWLAKDPEAQRLLGTCHRDPDGEAWRVLSLDTSDRGDIAHLVHVDEANAYAIQTDKTNKYRTVSVSVLDREYARMETTP